MTDSPAASKLDPYKDFDHPDFVDGVETRKDAETRKREDIMEAVRYGSCCGARVARNKEADRRLCEDRLLLRSRRWKQQQIEHTIAKTDPEGAWEEIALTAEWRVRDEEKWAEKIQVIINMEIVECATADDEDLYDRLEQLDRVLAEIQRHEVDRKMRQAHAERVAVLMPLQR
ncbi:hypothetical protein EJ08DRAFT_696344 [Tothia fuscella]|uniref:Uncharacterized protein n=1 Tax=Tothia fuscella TaxID=1048955 RepID=A0A9P4NTR1_9PEZI|nr:hypothetical protein EJ08DRAFT_696344 [Tothia fuscella]